MNIVTISIALATYEVPSKLRPTSRSLRVEALKPVARPPKQRPKAPTRRSEQRPENPTPNS